jgi:hypothetical protein
MPPLLSFLPWLGIALVYLSVPVGAFYLILRAIRAYERRGLEARDRASMDERLLRIEERLEAIGSDVDRLVQKDRFTARLTGASDEP